MFWPTGPEEIKTKTWNHAFASAGSDLKAVWLQQVMTITASVHPKSGRIINARSQLPVSDSVLFIWRYSLLLSRFTALMLHVILNEWLFPFIAFSVFWISTKVVYWQCYLVFAAMFCCSSSVFSLSFCCWHSLAPVQYSTDDKKHFSIFLPCSVVLIVKKKIYKKDN